MNFTSQSEKERPQNFFGGRIWIFVLGLLFVACLAISNQSFWIDEASTASKAQQTTFHNWWHEMFQNKGSDLQMPLYMFWTWVCEKFVGSSEIALRAANLFWFVPGFVALLCSLARRPPLQLSVFFVGTFSPFAWYYLDEARPYAMQMGTALLLFAVLCHWSEKPFSLPKTEPLWLWGFVIALFALSGASLLGMIWAGAAIVAAIFLLPKERLLQLTRDYIFVWLVAFVSLLALGFYYLWTLHTGGRASDAATTGWKNVAFTGYELLGLAGLGPGRLEIRDGGLQAFKPYALELGLFTALIFILLSSGLLYLLQNCSRKKIFSLTFVTASPAVFILAAGFILHFRVLGRHFAPLFPVVVFLLALGVTNLWRRHTIARIVVLVFFAFCFASCLSLRFAERHARDDYRSAAMLGKIALGRGELVWWNADKQGALVYHLPVTNEPQITNAAFLIANPDKEFARNLPKPDLVLVSKPDIYDNHNVLHNYLIQNNYHVERTLSAFTVWRKK